MSNELNRYSTIKSESLDPAHYTQSLLNEAMRAGILYGADVERIQLAALNILAERIQMYTRYESSSVKEEVAQSLFESVFYLIDTKLLTLSIPDAAECLRTADIGKLVVQGSALVKEDVVEVSILLRQVKDNRLKVDMLAYNDTIDKAIPSFLVNYDVNYAPQDTATTIDYPLSVDDMHICGVRYIINYLKTLLLENDFCHSFSNSEINQLLVQYGATYHFDSRDMLVNIFDLALTNSLCAVLLGKSAQTLCLSRNECRCLADKVGSASILSAAGHVSNELGLSDMQREYVKHCAQRLTPGLLLAVQQGTLEQMTAAC